MTQMTEINHSSYYSCVSYVTEIRKRINIKPNTGDHWMYRFQRSFWDETYTEDDCHWRRKQSEFEEREIEASQNEFQGKEGLNRVQWGLETFEAVEIYSWLASLKK